MQGSHSNEGKSVRKQWCQDIIKSRRPVTDVKNLVYKPKNKEDSNILLFLRKIPVFFTLPAQEWPIIVNKDHK